ncbi:hypothetical protein KAFR_0A06490 [Kazachstania africana CBS 2517]|uniref:Uncharacterized protein n=1 Tax=Kazachstania africana (strain ATCC 22294 / BCRC 22015 / CBS 2517 / CECT 1963 / NBRC 1671 / NRRL Y-8276) TaxID=1071382 RepID=H2ANY4_KAZAF|nr:hypothetical protein KAFR_0A06490 [Kazachstania africana CBS 2517]CCF56084.1 hypothetical protein KAFR_0A06490 [Kazachstania africana CBS 2517]
MNLLLQDPFSVLKEYPEKLTNTIVNPLKSTCLRFSPFGDYLAVGCYNGTIIVYDMDTMRPIKLFFSNQAIYGLDWSYNGKYLLSCSRDWHVKVWDLDLDDEPCGSVCFDGPVWGCNWIDSDRLSCVATVYEEKNAYLVDFELDSESNKLEGKIRPLRGDTEVEIANEQGYVLTSTLHPNSNSGTIIITGTSKGFINFYRLEHPNRTIKLIYSMKISNSNIKHIIVSSNGDRMAINSSDRTIRQYNLFLTDEVTMELEHKYQDVINKLQWNCIFFSGNSGDYLVASTHGSSTHELYLWETNTGTLVRVLEGTEEELMDIDWNFHTMTIASNGFETGNIYCWSIVIPPKWSALAPDFEEVDENVDYVEKENEFDDDDELQINEIKTLLNNEVNIQIDLITRDKFDVRSNDISQQQFVIPTDYSRIVLMKQRRHEHF